MLRADTRDASVRRVLFVALALNVAVAAAKIVLGRAADFLSVEADGYHSLTDGLGTVVALVGLGIARRPPDPGHPYGHRKFEILAGALIGVSLLAVAFGVARDAIDHVQRGTHHAPVIDATVVFVLAATLAVNLGVSIYQERRGRALESALLMSDARHTRSDCWVTAGVIATAVLAHVGHPELDVVAAIVVAAVIAKAGVEVVWSNARWLADAAVVDAERIRSAVSRIPAVHGAHSIRTRGTPGAVFVDLRVQVPAHLSVAEVHEISHGATEAIRAALATVADVTIHFEPVPGGVRAEGTESPLVTREESHHESEPLRIPRHPARARA